MNVLVLGLGLMAYAGTLAAKDHVAPQAEPQKKILVVHASRTDAPYTDLVERRFRKALSEGLEGRLDYYIEHVDFGRFATADYQAAVRDFLRRKYAGLQLDVIVADGYAPFEFLVRHRADVFPGVPVVFSAEEGDFPRIPNTTGVLFPVDMKGTLDVALQLQPHVKRVFVVRGASEFDRFYEGIARRQFQGYEGRVAFDFLPALSLRELVQTVGQLPSDAILYFVSLFEDGAGNRFIPVDVLTRLSSAANVPIYCWPEMTLGYGAVGGYLLSEERVAHETALLALRILRGEHPDRIQPIAARPYVMSFDARQLQRWDIPMDRLPPGSDVRFRSPTLWDRYRWQIVGATAVIVAQAALIAALLLQRERRRRAEVELQRHRDELAHAGRLATAGELTATIAHEINQPLGSILTNVDAAEMLLEAGPRRLEEIRRILVDIHNDDLRAAEVIRRLRSLLAKHQVARESVDLPRLVTEALRLLDGEARRRGVVLSTRFEPGVPMIICDRVQVQQVIINLVVNAMDAMGRAEAGEQIVFVDATLRQDGDVEIAVIDNGPGIAPNERGRVFEPYFTTKEHGMGLGLSIARTIVEAQGGTIWMDPVPSGGSAFRFTLPSRELAQGA